MLAAARERIAQSGLAQHHVVAGGRAGACLRAQPLRSHRVAVWRWMFFADPTAAFRNLLGAERPGGRLCFACWAALEENRHWLIPYEVALRAFGTTGAEASPRTGTHGVCRPGIRPLVPRRAGYEGIEIRRETPEIIGASPREEAEHALVMGPSARLIEEKNPSESVRELIKQEMTEAFAAYAKGREMVLPSTIFLVTARRGRFRNLVKIPTPSGQMPHGGCNGPRLAVVRQSRWM